MAKKEPGATLFAHSRTMGLNRLMSIEGLDAGGMLPTAVEELVEGGYELEPVVMGGCNVEAFTAAEGMSELKG